MNAPRGVLPQSLSNASHELGCIEIEIDLNTRPSPGGRPMDLPGPGVRFPPCPALGFSLAFAFGLGAGLMGAFFTGLDGLVFLVAIGRYVVPHCLVYQVFS